MRSYIYLLPIIFLLVLWSSCRKDFEYAPSTGNLEFSKDTVFLDTIFSNIGSSTYTLVVYNRNRDDLEIPSIRLAQGQNSHYRLNVDGLAGKEFQNIPILAQDSLFIFIETTFDISEIPENQFLYSDAIQFGSGIYQQDIELVTLVKDVVFLYPTTLSDGTKETLILGTDENGNELRTEGFYLNDSQLNFTNQKPYIIYGYAAVGSDKELTIDSGARVHFHNASGLYVSENGSIKINGELSLDQELLENEIVFEGDRLEPEYADVPGQWGALWLSAGSTDNKINHLTIRNATIGLFVEGDDIPESNTLEVKNSQIYNSANVNFWARTASVRAENLVLGNAGNMSLYCNLGGDYSFTHCTIANYWNQGFRTGSTVQIDNYSDISGLSLNEDLIQADFYNCIIDGNNDLELYLGDNGTNSFNYSFDHCLLKFNDNEDLYSNDPLYDFENVTLYDQVILNENADFIQTATNNFRIGELSAANEKANLEIPYLVPFDILGIDRSLQPDIGAYQN